MKTRALAALVAVGALTTASCGADSDSGLSTSEFRDALAEICDDTNRDADRIDVPSLADPGDFEEFAEDLRKVIEDAKEDLDALDAPDELSDEFDELKEVIEDQIGLLGDLEEAGKAEDADEITEISQRFAERQEERGEIADDLRVDECEPQTQDDDPQDTSPDTTAAETVPATDAPETTATTAPPTTTPPTTAPPVTLPTSTAPPATDPPETEPDETDPPETEPDDTDPPDTIEEALVLFDIMNLTAEFNSFPGYSIAQPNDEYLDAFVQTVASDEELNFGIDRMGVGILVDDVTGEEVAVLAVGFAFDQTLGMPNAWKDQFCNPAFADFYTTASGNLGVTCDLTEDPDSPFFEVFTATTPDFGLTIALLSFDVTMDELVDGFVGAN